jgi:hypothetical protein
LKIVVFDRPVVQGTVPEETGMSLIRTWRIRVVTMLVLVGGTIGGLVGSHRFWSSSPPVRLRFWQKALAPAGIFAFLVLIGPPKSNEPSLFVRFTNPLLPNANTRPATPPEDAIVEAAGLAILSAVIGWAVTTVVVAWGRLLPPWSPPEQAADYDDSPRANPACS